MGKVRSTMSSSTPSRKSRPALTPEARENQMIALAVDLAEQQLRDGTASSQVITHYLKLGTMRERLELKILEEERNLKAAKREEIQSRKEIKELYQEALVAMRQYSGHGGPEDD